MSNLLMVILMATPGGAEQSNPSSQIIFLLLIVGVFYFFMIRPQMKKQKELKNFRKELKKGDKVVTTGGIYGKINDVKENIITMEISPNVHIKVDINSVVSDISDIPQKK